MAGVKISELPAGLNPQLSDFVAIVQLAGSVTDRKTLQQILSLFNQNITGYLPLAGGTMLGNLILNADATAPLQAVTYEQLQAFGQGISIVLAATAATTVNLNAVYANGAAGVGATLTDNGGTFAAFTVDGVSPALNSRILVKNQTTTFQNGIYTLTTNGDGISIPWVLTRAADYDQAPSEIFPGTLVLVNTGTVNAITSWLETATVNNVGTDPILFSQFTFSGGAFLLRANNLNDVASVAASLVNLGLGVPTGTGNVVLQTTPTMITPILGVATATSVQFNPTTSGIKGTLTNNNASPGIVGEILSSVIPLASAFTATTGVSNDLTFITLTPGDWDVWGNLSILGSNIQGAFGWTSIVSGTLPDPSLYNAINGAGSLLNFHFNVPHMRYSVGANTVLYLTFQVAFASGSTVVCGGIYARRVR